MLYRSSRCAAVSALTAALCACSSGQTAAPPVVPPVITSFSADKTEVTSGTAVKLTFTAERAKEVKLYDPSGNPIALSGDANGGEATVTPAQSSFYLLKASGEGGKDSAFAQVAVNEGLKSVFLIAVPAELDSGDEVTVAWAAIGGTGITLKDASGQTLSTAESGSLTQTPAHSNDYQLRATGLGGPLSASASVKVRPVVTTFTAEPAAVKQGETLTLQWKTLGADQVKLSEATFGDLITLTSGPDVAEGSFDFTVPSDFAADAGALPDGGVAVGRPVPDNFPLRFTLEASTTTPALTTTATLGSYVRQGPTVVTFDVPKFVSEGRPATVSWTLTGAYRAELQLDGATVLATVPPATANGTLTLPVVTADVAVTLIAYDFNGLKVSQTKTLKAAKAPKVTAFTLPLTLGTGGTATTATWATTNATSVVIRSKGGPAEHFTATAAMVASGTTQLRPARTTTYVLEAYNDAGDRDVLEKTLTVATPVNATATPSPAAPNTLVRLDWDVTAQSPIDVIGIPVEPPSTRTASTGFFDIHATPGVTKLGFSSANDATATFTTPAGFQFPIIGQGTTTFSACTNGWLALQATGSTTAANVDLHATSGLPAFALAAPLWDDLDLGPDGSVEWLVDGAAFPRRLVVQWNRVRIAGDPASELTFQAQLFETGEVRFEYLKLLDGSMRAAGVSATVGLFFGAGIFQGQFSYNATQLSEGLGIDWLTLGPTTGTRSLVVGSTSFAPGFFIKLANGGYVWVTNPVRVFAANSVLVNEVMPQAASGVAEGQYLELFNPASFDVDLGGLEVSARSSSAQTFIVPPNTTLKKNGWLVLGQSTTAANNGGAPVDVGYGGSVVLTPADIVELKVLNSVLPDAGPAGPFLVTSYAWSASTAGTAVQRDPALGGGVPACTYTQTYGPGGASIGTPGGVNESCFPYVLSTITEAFEDVSGRPDAGPLLSTSGWDVEVGTVSLAQPFTYCGADAGTTVSVSSNGWLSLKTETSAADTNKTAPGSSSPRGAIAVYWDDLINSSLGATDSNVFAARSGDHHVVQWRHASPYRSSTADRTGDLNFEAKLFDTGVIELHFGAMSNAPNGSATSAGNDGASATVWLELPDGGAALPVTINTAGTIAPHTAYRFTPRP